MNGKNVLLVEDSATDMELMVHVLKRTGWHLVQARDGAEAQRILRRDAKFRFACVDLSLPGMDGVHLVRFIKETYPHIAVAVVSGVITNQQQAQLRDVGACFLFPKPFTNENVQDLLNFMDVTEAIFNKAKPIRPSWETTIGGLLTIGMGIYAAVHKPDATAFAIILIGASLLRAQDSSVMKGLVGGAGKKEA